MKYMSNGGLPSNPHTRLSLISTLVLLLALWVTNALLYLSRMGLDPSSVVRHYRGSEDEFLNPRTVGSMLEVTHAHLATMTVVVLLLTHLAALASARPRTKVLSILVPFLALLLGEGASWLVRFVSSGFAILKVAAFVLFQISLFLLILALGRALLRPAGNSPGVRIAPPP